MSRKHWRSCVEYFWCRLWSARRAKQGSLSWENWDFDRRWIEVNATVNIFKRWHLKISTTNKPGASQLKGFKSEFKRWWVFYQTQRQRWCQDKWSWWQEVLRWWSTSNSWSYSWQAAIENSEKAKITKERQERQVEDNSEEGISSDHEPSPELPGLSKLPEKEKDTTKANPSPTSNHWPHHWPSWK